MTVSPTDRPNGHAAARGHERPDAHIWAVQGAPWHGRPVLVAGEANRSIASVALQLLAHARLFSLWGALSVMIVRILTGANGE